MLKFGNIVLTNNSNWLNIPEHNVITSGNHGTVTASPNKGIQGTEVTLSNSPDTGYEFSSYSVTGATLKNDNQFDIANSNVTVVGNFIASTPSLPAYTLRLRFTDGHTPTNSKGTLTQVSASPNIWDWTYNNPNWTNAWFQYKNLLEVVDAGDTSNVTNMTRMFFYSYDLTSISLFDTSNVTDMTQMFDYCYKLTAIPLFDTSNVTSMAGMFTDCHHLTSVPLFNTSKVTNMNYMFDQCYDVKSGALALYQQASSQTTPPSAHTRTFTACGSNTTTGAAELAQIPSDWK